MKLRKRVRKLERRIDALTRQQADVGMTETILRDSTPVDVHGMWGEQVERYEHGGWDGEDWNPRGYL